MKGKGAVVAVTRQSVPSWAGGPRGSMRLY
jgi:hypothetical protein